MNNSKTKDFKNTPTYFPIKLNCYTLKFLTKYLEFSTRHTRIIRQIFEKRFDESIQKILFPSSIKCFAPRIHRGGRPFTDARDFHDDPRTMRCDVKGERKRKNDSLGATSEEARGHNDALLVRKVFSRVYANVTLVKLRDNRFEIRRYGKWSWIALG